MNQRCFSAYTYLRLVLLCQTSTIDFSRVRTKMIRIYFVFVFSIIMLLLTLYKVGNNVKNTLFYIIVTCRNK